MPVIVAAWIVIGWGVGLGFTAGMATHEALQQQKPTAGAQVEQVETSTVVAAIDAEQPDEAE